eukprot:366482-Chlamydomonas_euryale.AAC.4
MRKKHAGKLCQQPGKYAQMTEGTRAKYVGRHTAFRQPRQVVTPPGSFTESRLHWQMLRQGLLGAWSRRCTGAGSQAASAHLVKNLLEVDRDACELQIAVACGVVDELGDLVEPQLRRRAPPPMQVWRSVHLVIVMSSTA